MSDQADEKLDQILTGMKDMAEEVHKIRRGMYGDPENNVDGLIRISANQDKRIRSLEDTRKKALWVGGSLLAIIEGGWHGLKEWLK